MRRPRPLAAGSAVADGFRPAAGSQRTVVWALYAILVALLLNSCDREISGNYIAKFTNGMYWLQLVKTPDNHLTGQLEEFLLRADGRIDRDTIAVAGAVDGSIVTMSATTLGLQVLTLSGSFDGNTLTLTGGQPSPVLLARSSLAEYQRGVNALSAQSQRILAERDATAARERAAQAQEDFLAEISRVVGRLEAFDSKADTHLNEFPKAEERYHGITTKMAEYVDRERQIAGNTNAAADRGQLDVAASQALVATDQLHNAVQSLQWSFQTDLQPLAAEAAHLEEGCRGTTPPGGLALAQAEARSAACERLHGAEGSFRQRADAMGRGLLHLEQDYVQERKTQEELLRTAQRLE